MLFLHVQAQVHSPVQHQIPQPRPNQPEEQKVGRVRRPLRDHEEDF